MTNPVVESRRTALSGKKSIYDSAFLPPVIPSNKIKFAFNATGRNKDWDFKKLAANFQDTEGTLEDVQQHIKAGHAICAGLLGGKWRSKANVIGSQWLLLDIDNSDVARDTDGKPIKDENGNSIKVYDPQLTISEALAHSFIQKHCALMYTTASHKPDWHKFRLIFPLPQYVEGADTVEACTRKLMQQLPHDPACKDASRVFYGSTEAEFPLVNPEATLPAEWIQEAIAIALHEREEYQLRIQEIESRRKEWREISLTEGWDIDQLIQNALSFIPPRTPGSGNYDECRQVLMALVNHYGASEAEIIAEQWSPSIKGSTWNIHAKIRSFRRGGISIGTLFHIAKQYGFRFPQRQYEPNVGNKGVISREQWELGRVREDLSSFQNLLKQAIAPFSSIFKGFKAPPTPKPLPEIDTPSANVIIYKRGSIPHRSEVTGNISISCQPEEHIAAWVEAVSKGWTQILDNSHPGLGKSYNAGQLTAGLFGVDKLIYQDANHRNPSTLPIETNFVDLPVRHNGFKLDPTRKTPTGEDFKLWTKAGETADTDGNCHRTYLFNAFRNKNFSSLDFEESGISPICGGCSLKNQCRFASGDGFGFRFQKRTAIQNYSELRAHPDSTPVTLTNAADQTFTVGRLWEEAGTLIKPVRSVDVNLGDFETTVGKLLLLEPNLLSQLQPALLVLHQLLTQQLKPTDRYGFDDASIRALLPAFPTGLDIEAIQQASEPDLTFLEDLDSIDITQDKQLKKSSAARYAAKKVVKDSARTAGREFLDLPNYWLPDFLEAWKGDGSFQSQWGVLSIYRPNPKHTELAKSAQFNIYLDATFKSHKLKLKLGIDDPVLVIEQQRPDYDNLKVVNVTGLGKLPKNRSLPLSARVNALKETLKKLCPNLGIIDWKQIATQAEVRTEYGHFVDGRGVNRFSECDAIASFGIPYQNIGVLAAQYQVMTGEPVNLEDKNSTFQKYLTELINAEIIQEIGRLRAHRRSNVELTFYFCADYDLNFLLNELPRVKLESVDAFQLCPEAGKASEQTGHAIVNALTQLWQSKQKITQPAIANIAEISQAWVSRFTQRWGGWQHFKKLLLLLLDSLNSGSNKNLADLDDDETWLARTYFPMLIAESESSLPTVLEGVAEVAQVFDTRAMRRVLNFCTPQVRADLLMIVLSCLPTEIYSISVSPLSASLAEPALSP
ncbi:PriCT-2 domain-containing protein [Nostoc sp. 'Peltigera membranacea cyanobiont' 232]|uniref:PriCT-2 domain-containing protein n=1 Tax=Nostoc sp. 'Peltigera membranacea cyanobiont' 232 TaxID=2014531 RepID=UPI000B952244|nr:PriCT-2 domain-containing protein [Nostoc sp. 'Peltigera membranacea cyanobiont' 232]OYE03100.1 DNA primase [Nostoc sp. 'Peltigera membranacea cyanobiont' 232]